MSLFQLGDFKLASGASSRWKIECDALTVGDWVALAAMAAEVLPPFHHVAGVPRGGMPFAEAMNEYRTKAIIGSTYLYCEDVVTSGRSLQHFRASQWPHGEPNGINIVGVCVFARGECPGWVTPLFQMPIKKG